MKFIIENPGGVATPLRGRVTENGPGGRGLSVKQS